MYICKMYKFKKKCDRQTDIQTKRFIEEIWLTKRKVKSLISFGKPSWLVWNESLLMSYNVLTLEPWKNAIIGNTLTNYWERCFVLVCNFRYSIRAGVTELSVHLWKFVICMYYVMCSKKTKTKKNNLNFNIFVLLFYRHE